MHILPFFHAVRQLTSYLLFNFWSKQQDAGFVKKSI